MKIKQLHLKNYGRFEDLQINFAPTVERQSNVTVIVGNNGAGKSQVLQALAIGMSWFVNSLLDSNGEKTTKSKEDNEFLKFPYEGEYIKQSQIKLQKNNAELYLSFDGINNEAKGLRISATRKEVFQPAVYGIDDVGFNALINQYAELYQVNKAVSLPLVANYTVDRNVTVGNISSGYNFMSNQLSAYENFLSAGSSYDNFFQWFKDNEDVENEKNNNKLAKSEKVDELIESQIRLHELLLRRNDLANLDIFPDDEVRYQELAELSAEIEKERDHYNSLSIRDHLINEAISQEQFTSLNSVCDAIEDFTGFKNPRIRRQDKPTMVVEKDGEELDVNQLSQGEKSLLALVGDIARRLAILNPSLDNPLEGDGVVMIDEVDLHLHPKWQHDLIDKLVTTFPNLQFILTTHSPHVISDRNDILLYSLDDGELTQMPNVYGEDVNTVLTKIMDVDIRDSEVEKQFTEIRRAISKREYQIAEEKINDLSDQLPPDNLELLKCRLMLAKAKLANSDNANHATN